MRAHAATPVERAVSPRWRPYSDRQWARRVVELWCHGYRDRGQRYLWRWWDWEKFKRRDGSDLVATS